MCVCLSMSMHDVHVRAQGVQKASDPLKLDLERVVSTIYPRSYKRRARAVNHRAISPFFLKEVYTLLLLTCLGEWQWILSHQFPCSPVPFHYGLVPFDLMCCFYNYICM